MPLESEIVMDGSVNTSGVGVIECDGIRLDVSREYRDDVGEKYVLLDVHAAEKAYRFTLSPEKATAVASLLLHAVDGLKS